MGRQQMQCPNREEALRSIRRNTWSPKYIEVWVSDKDFIAETVKYTSAVLKYAPMAIRNDREFVTNLIKINPSVFSYISEELAHDRAYIKEMMLNYEVSLWSLPYDLQDDEEFIEIAVTLEPMLKRFLPDKYAEKENYELH
jgi:hypothetical protein